MTKIIYKLNKKVILISLLIIGLFMAILFTFTHSKELSESDTISLEVEEESLGTYYLKVTYDGIDKKGQDSKNNNETEIFSDDIKVSDVLPPGIIFNGFEETIDGTIGAKYENGKMCPGRVVDDSGENFTTISGYDSEGNEIQVYSTYHGLHYDEETRTISFIVRGLKAGCNLEVGIGIKHPSLEGRLRRDFYNTALVNEKKQSAVSNYLHTWMGLKDVNVYKVKYEFENLDEELINLTSNLLPRYDLSYPEGENVSLLNISLLGYEFSGWKVKEGNVTLQNEKSFIMPSEDVTLVGSFTKKDIPEYSVIYKVEGEQPNDFEPPSTKKYFVNDTVKLDDYAIGDVIEGYRFIGWEIKDENLEWVKEYKKVGDVFENIVSTTDFIMPSHDVEVYLKFEKFIPVINFAFISDVKPDQSERYLPNPIQANKGTYINLDEIAKVSDVGKYHFLGWIYDKEFVMPNEDITIEGEWTIIDGIIKPDITKEIVNKKTSYKVGDTIEYLITITNNEDFIIKNVVIEDKLPNAILYEDEYGSLEGSRYSYKIVNNAQVIEIVKLNPKESLSIKATYKVTENDSQIINNEVQVISLDVDGGNYIVDPDTIARAEANVKSKINICNNIIGKDGVNKEISYHIENDNLDFWTKLKNGKCQSFYVEAGNYKVTEIIPQEFTLESATKNGSFYQNGSTFNISESNYDLEFNNKYKKKGFNHSSDVVKNIVPPNRTLNVGDSYSFGNESFHIIGYDEEAKTYTLFADYNLYVGNTAIGNDAKTVQAISKDDELYGKQSELAIGDKDKSNGTDANLKRYGVVERTNVNKYVEQYVNYLKNTFNIEVISGRLINYDELTQAIGCTDMNDQGSNKGCSMEANPNVKYSWINNTTFWTDARVPKNQFNYTNTDKNKDSMYEYIVGGDGFFKALAPSVQNGNKVSRGVRPVIVVPANAIKAKNYIMPDSWQDDGIFSDYYNKAYNKVKNMSLEEKVGQLLVMTYSNSTESESAVKNYNLGGVIFFKKDFDGKTEVAVKSMINNLQSKANETNSKIPLLMAVDEEGGIVTRIASNPNLISTEKTNYPNLFATYERTVNNEKQTFNAFKSPKDLYLSGDNNFDLIIEETKVKTNVLKRLGLNVNFAPVVDVSKSGSYMYENGRSLSDDQNIVAEYAKTVINTSHINDKKVSYTLKHFPGYGDAGDTHNAPSTDSITLEELKNKSLAPFKAGIEAGAEAIMVNHVKYDNIDNVTPASLSKKIHDILFKDIGFTGIAITDDLGMQGATDTNRFKKAVAAGNHQLLVSEKYETAYNQIKEAVQKEETIEGVVLNEEYLNKLVFKVLAWKYYKGLLT